MSIPALLTGCTNYLAEALGESVPVGPRVTDGAPWGAYKSGMGWYVGVYFAGGTVKGGESHECTYSVGVDVTRVVPTRPTKSLGEFLTGSGELWSMVRRINQLMLAGRGRIRTACEAALVGTEEEGRATFREQFHTGNIGKAQEKSPEWILGVPGERQTGAILVVPQTFGGLKCWMLLSEI